MDEAELEALVPNPFIPDPAAPIATTVEEWLSQDYIHWEGPPDLVEWSRPFGADYRQAWHSAERPEHLLALSALFQPEPEPLLRVATVVAREGLVHIPRNEKRSRRAVFLAERWHLGSEIPHPERETHAAMAVVDDLIAREERAEKAYAAARPACTPIFARIVDAALAAGAEESARFGDDEEQAKRRVAPRVAEALLEAHATEPALLLLQRCARDLWLIVAEAHAARAAASLLVSTSSLTTARKAFQLTGRIVERGNASGERPVEQVMETMRISRRSIARVYTEAALVFSHAADAEGDAVGASDRAWQGALSAFGGVFVDVVLTPGEANPAAGAEAMQAVLQAHRDQAAEAKRRELADRIRQALPFEKLMPRRD